MTDLPHQTGTGPQRGQEKSQGAAAALKPMFDPETFVLEEYKVVHAKISQQRDAVSRLETLLIGGTVVAVGILLGIGRTKSDPVPWGIFLFAWWALFLVVFAATFRCWSHYIYITHLRNYVIRIEVKMKDAGYELDGVESYSEGNWLAVLYIAVSLISAVLVGIVLVLAILESLRLFPNAI